MVYAAYDETMRTFSYKPYENWATRRSKEKLNKPNNEPLLADELYKSLSKPRTWTSLNLFA